MPGSINDGQQPLAVHGDESNHHLYNEQFVTTTTHQEQDDHLYGNDNDTYEEYAEKPAAPVKRPFYKNKKYWLICSIITVIVTVVVVLLILFVAFPKIAQSTLNHSTIQVNTAQITFEAPPDSSTAGSTVQKRDVLDANSTFYMHMVTDLKNTGPFSAQIQFEDNVQVLYNNTVLGTITLPDTHISGGRGSIDTVTAFKIADVAAFSAFSRYMLASESFTWTLNGKAKITALTRYAFFSRIFYCYNYFH